jgi:hypothetical protein
MLPMCSLLLTLLLLFFQDVNELLVRPAHRSFSVGGLLAPTCSETALPDPGENL